MTIQQYTPQVACEDPEAKPTAWGPVQACQSVLNRMQVATWPQVFGRAGDPGVQVALPISIADGQFSI